MSASELYQIRTDEDGHFDELIAKNPASVHFEMMDDGLLWVGLTYVDGPTIHLQAGVNNANKLFIHCSEYPPTNIPEREELHER